MHNPDNLSLGTQDHWRIVVYGREPLPPGAQLPEGNERFIPDAERVVHDGLRSFRESVLSVLRWTAEELGFYADERYVRAVSELIAPTLPELQIYCCGRWRFMKFMEPVPVPPPARG